MHIGQSCLLVSLCYFLLVSCMIRKLPMPDGVKIHFNGARMMHNISDVPGEQIFWECMQRVMWQMAEQMGHNVTRETRDYLDRLLQIAVDPSKEQFPRIRKEYRMMTDDERDRFHKAIQALKEDTTLEPNVYSAIAELHAGDVIPMAHFGAAFPGWHRILLLIFETALRLKDPSVSIPYWASNLDNEMEDPTKSIVWSEQFLGNGDGFVTTGPFANFKVYSTDTILTRNIGASGSLMTNDGIHGILSRNRTAHITYPSAPKQYNLELQHNALHVWMGGNMDDLSQSAEDPVFYLHHSFVDYLWEEFRTRQKMIGVDPETDYPESNWGDDKHAPDAAIGFGDLRNVDALSNVIADLVKYDPSPVCTRSHPTCISKYLRCDSSRSYPACVSLSQEELNPLKDNHVEICVEAHLTRAVQNTFSINQYCDIRKWAYIPVKIVLQRPPEFTNYKAFPVLNNKPVMTTDVFSTISVNRNITEHLAAYPNCKVTSAVARKIYVESYGLNYYGKYKDFTVLDQRHALSSATTYLGVKSPESNYTDVIVYAFDYCGRTCRPFCLDVASNPPKSTPCSGVLRITSEDPKLYGDDYAEAVNMLWNADSPDELPENAPLHFITFYCDYSGTWPWDGEMQRKVHGPKGQFKHEPVLRESNVQDVVHQKLVQPVVANKRPPLRTANTPNPVEKAKTASQTVPEKKKKTGNINRQTSRRITIIRARRKQSTPKPRAETISNIQRTQPQVSRTPNVLLLDLSDATGRPPISNRHLRQPTNTQSRVNDRSTRYTEPNKLFQHRPIEDFGQSSPINSPQKGFRFGEGCRLHRNCNLPVPCSPCMHKTRQPCLAPSRMIAICVNGVFMLETMYFDFIG